jgi:hypothetical protein
VSIFDRAIDAFRDFHWGEEPDELVEVEDERYEGETLVELGRLRAVTYTTNKGGEGLIDYVHDFETEGDDPPRLCVDDDGNLAIVGGSYEVTPRGIEG